MLIDWITYLGVFLLCAGIGGLVAWETNRYQIRKRERLTPGGVGKWGVQQTWMVDGRIVYRHLTRIPYKSGEPYTLSLDLADVITQVRVTFQEVEVIQWDSRISPRTIRM